VNKLLIGDISFKKLLPLLIILDVWLFAAHAQGADLTGCRPQLEKSLCYSAPIDHWTFNTYDVIGSLKLYQNRECRPMPEKIRQTLLSIYDSYPPEIQQAFCEIRRLFVVTGNLSYGALTDYYFDVGTVKITQGLAGHHFSGKPTGYIMEVSEQNRFKSESASDYMTRVLQARFADRASSSIDLPVAQYETPFGENGALATTIVHEIGHMLGRAQKVTSTYFLPLSESPWSEITFRLENGNYRLIHAPPGYQDRASSKALVVNDVSTTFDLFEKSGTATLYGAANPQEDLAESFMLFFYGNLKWKVKGKDVFDLQAELTSNPVFREKSEILRKLMGFPEPFSLKNRKSVSGDLGV